MSHEIAVKGGTLGPRKAKELLFTGGLQRRGMSPTRNGQSLDAQGQSTAIHTAFALHHVGHANARSKYGHPVE